MFSFQTKKLLVTMLCGMEREMFLRLFCRAPSTISSTWGAAVLAVDFFLGGIQGGKDYSE